MEFLIFFGLLFFGGWIIRTVLGGAKATIKTVAGQGSLADNLQNEIVGMGEFQFRAVKQTKQLDNKPKDLFFMQFKGLFPYNLTKRNLSFLFTIYDNTDSKEGTFVLCPVPGFNEGTTTTFQHVVENIPPFQSDYGWKSWVDLGYAPLEFLKFPKKGNRKLQFQCAISLLGSNVTTKYGFVDSGKDNVIAVYNFDMNYNNPNSGYLEISEERIIVEKSIIYLCFYIAAADGNIDESEGKVIKKWVEDQRDSAPRDKKDETKKRLNENILNAVKVAKSKDLSISKVIKDINDNATKSEKYEALELALAVMSADGVAAQEELQELDVISKKIGIDPKEYNNLRDKSITKVDVVADKEEAGTNSNVQDRKKKLSILLNFNMASSKDEIKKHLTNEAAKYLAMINLNDEKKKSRAEEMLKLIAEARKLFIEE